MSSVFRPCCQLDVTCVALHSNATKAKKIGETHLIQPSVVAVSSLQVNACVHPPDVQMQCIDVQVQYLESRQQITMELVQVLHAEKEGSKLNKNDTSMQTISVKRTTLLCSKQ
jgi:hypothetical protein